MLRIIHNRTTNHLNRTVDIVVLKGESNQWSRFMPFSGGTLGLQMVTIVPPRPVVSNNKNLYIYYISIHFYNCQNRTAVEPLIPHRSNRSHHSKPISGIVLHGLSYNISKSSLDDQINFIIFQQKRIFAVVLHPFGCE